MTIHTAADIAGSGAAVQLSSTQGTFARRIWLTAHGSSNARFGGPGVAAAQGVELPADALVTVSASDADISDRIDLTTAYVYVPNGTTLTVAWGN